MPAKRGRRQVGHRTRRWQPKDLESLRKQTGRATLTGLHSLPEGEHLALSVERGMGSASTQKEYQDGGREIQADFSSVCCGQGI